MVALSQVLLISVACIINTFAADIPPFIHVCHKEDPNLEQCMIASVEDLRPYLVTGVSEYNIPSLEPLIMTDFFSEEAAGMKITTYNVSAWGCTDFFVRGLNVNLDTNLISLDLEIPKLRIEAHYSVDGKMILVPIKGGGNLEANITDCASKTTLTGELYEENGETHLKFTSIDLKVHIGGGNIRLENLFNGDKVLLSVINDVVNKNFDSFTRELMPAIEKAMQSQILTVANNVVQPFTYKQLFPH